MEETLLRNLKKGDYFTLKPIEYPRESQVYVKDDYDKGMKKFAAYKFSDINFDRYFKGDTIVYTDFTF